jgi:maltose O-acetyltransferase
MSRISESARLNKLKQGLWDWVVNGVLASYIIPVNIRTICLRILGLKLNKSSINAHCFIGSKRLIIQDKTYVNRECLFNNEGIGAIYIGSNCAIGYRTSFYTTTHDFSDKNRRAGKVESHDIVIRNGCWIGANVTILPGVEIGQGSIIAAGSVVVHNCEANCIYGGVPAKVIRKLD